MKKLVIFYCLICFFSCNEEKNNEDELVQELLNVAKKHKTRITNLNEIKAHLTPRAIHKFDSILFASDSGQDILYTKGYADTFYTLDEKDVVVEKRKKQ